MKHLTAVLVLGLSLALSRAAIAGQTDQQAFQKVVKKVLKLHCVCPTTDPGGLGELAQFSGPGINGRTYVGLVCNVPEFDAAGNHLGNGQCDGFQVLSK